MVQQASRKHVTEREVKVSALDETDKPVETHRTKMSQPSMQEILQAEQWGKNADGFQAGGNFEDDPKLVKYTVRKYAKMKNQGLLSQHGLEGDGSRHQMS